MINCWLLQEWETEFLLSKESMMSNTTVWEIRNSILKSIKLWDNLESRMLQSLELGLLVWKLPLLSELDLRIWMLLLSKDKLLLLLMSLEIKLEKFFKIYLKRMELTSSQMLKFWELKETVRFKVFLLTKRK